jgi:DNA polymerase IV
MNLPLNHNDPLIMHIDLNSCFATVEQQANPLLRGRPLAIAAYTGPGGCVISPSIEAKRHGVKVGMTVRDAKLLCPEIEVRPPDPPKYRSVHSQFAKIFKDYSPTVTPKSIDEAVIDFSESRVLFTKSLVEIGREIKDRMRKEIGEWISCSIGIAPNRFLAKLAASLHKPDGLDRIDHTNLLDIYSKIELLDLSGINTHFQARLNASDIFTPLEFLAASLEVLQKQVFRSIVGYYWYLRLRGWEVDAVNFARKSYGQSYALQKPTAARKELAPLLMKLTEKMGRRLRRAAMNARGIHVSSLYQDFTHWHQGHLFHTSVFTTQELYQRVMLVFNNQPQVKPITHLAVSCYDLSSTGKEQLDLFESDKSRKRRLSYQFAC